VRRTHVSGFTIAAAIALTASLASGQYLEATIRVFGNSQYLLWNPVGNKLYVLDGYGTPLTVVDGATNQIQSTVQIAEYSALLCYNSQMNKVYTASGENNLLSVIDGVGDTVIRTLHLSHFPSHMAYNAQMNKLYVSTYDDYAYGYVLDAGPDTLLDRIHLPRWGVGQMWVPMANRVFYASPMYDSTYVLDCLTDEVIARYSTPDGATAYGACWNPVTGLVYLPSGSGTYVFSTNGESLLQLIPGCVGFLCAAPFANKLYSISGPSYVIDGATNAVIRTLDVSGSVVLYDSIHRKVYCLHENGRRLNVVDAVTDSLVVSLPIGRDPQSMCWNPVNSRVYIGGGMDTVVYVIRDTTTGVSEERSKVSMGQGPGVTVIGSRLELNGADKATLFDMSGGQVMKLRRGVNSVAHVPPGVYFVRDASEAAAGSRKVVIAY
jgi:DNA-binding beta-propeller fold protein YncE